MAEAKVELTFYANTKRLEQSIKKVGDSTAESVSLVEKAAAKTSEVAAAAAGAVSKAYQGLKDRVSEISTAIAGLLGASTLSVGAIGGSAVKAASNFEQLKARLEGLTGSAEEAGRVLQEAIGFAASTPFSVEEIVQATATLEAFGQGGVENLNLVAETAAGTGQSLNDTALRYGKALSGISEGFQGLRDTSGITAEKLGQFGAVTKGVGNVSLQTKEEVDKAREALKAFAKSQFGGSLEKQSATLAGAFSNLGDATTNLLAELGQVLIPLLSKGARALSDFINWLTAAIRPYKEFAVAGLAAVGVAGAFGTAVAGMAAVFAGTIAQSLLLHQALGLISNGLLKIPIAAQGMAKVSAAINAFAASNTLAGKSLALFSGAAVKAKGAFLALQGALAGAAKASLAFLATPMGIALGVIAAAAAAAKLAIRNMEKETAAMNKRLKEASDASASAKKSFREASDALEKLSGTKVDFGTSVEQSAELSAEALAKLTPRELQARVEELGLSSEGLAKSLKEIKPAAASAERQLALLSGIGVNAETGLVDLAGTSEETRSAFVKLFGEGEVSAEDFRLGIARLQIEFDNLKKAETIFQFIQDRLGALPGLLEKATKGAGGLNDFLQFAKSSESAAELTGTLGVVEQRIAAVRRTLAEADITGSFEQLTEALADPKTSEAEAKAIRAFLQLQQQRQSIEEKISSLNEQAVQARIAAFELETDRRKALGELTLSDERNRIQQQLELVKKGTRDEVGLLQELADIDKQIREERVKIAKDLIETQVASVQRTLDRSIKSDTSAEDQKKKIEEAIRGLEAFKKAQGEAFALSGDGADRFNSSLDRLRDKLAEVEREIPVERFEELQKSFKNSIGAADGSAAKLEATSNALNTLKAAIGAGTVEQNRGLELQAELEAEILGLNKEINAEKDRQANEIAALQRQALQQEIALLEAKKAAGEAVEDELDQKREELFQAELDRIETQKQADLAANISVAQAEEKAALRIALLKGNETKRQFEEAEKLRKEAEKEEKRAAKEVAKEKKTANSAGRSSKKSTSSDGSNSQLFDNFGFSLGASPFASDGNASFSAGFGQFSLGKAAKAGQKAADFAPTKGFSRASSAVNEASTISNVTNNNVNNQVTVNVESRKTRNVPTPEDALREVEKAITTAQFFDPQAGIG